LSITIANQEKHSQQMQFWLGVKDCLPTLLGYISIGIAFGVVGSASGISILEIGLLSLLVYGGSSQFIICALFMANTPISVVILTTFIVNLRHFLMGLAIAPAFKTYSIYRNIGIGVLLTDETFGVATTKLTQHSTLNDRWMNGLNLTAYLFWFISSMIGALLGQWIADPEALGLDFALTAMFVALLVLQMQQLSRSMIMHYLALIAYTVIFMFLFLLFLPSHMAVILSTVIVATIGVLTKK